MPKVLLATTCRWISAARIGMALRETGCIVDAVCPPGHPLRTTDVFSQLYSYNGLRPLPWFLDACERSNPDIVVPCDELAAQNLHRLYLKNATPVSIRQLIERSLGDASHFSTIESRSEFLAIAKREGIDVPETAILSSIADLEDWLSGHPLPAVLKADGTSGGEGVWMATSLDDATKAFRTLRAPLASSAALKRAIIDHDYNYVGGWIKRTERKVSIQPVITGRDANIAFFAWQGEIVASISVDVIRTTVPKGPASVVKLRTDDTLLHAAKKIAKKFGLSGFGGLDFITDSASGKPYLIELNSRVTQTCHLPLRAPRDLPGALYSVLSGEPLRELHAAITSDTIALFPGAWQSDPTAEIIRTGYHDVPWQQPALVREGVAPPGKINRQNWLAVKARLRATGRTQEKHEA